jgi:hypothetical protein
MRLTLWALALTVGLASGAFAQELQQRQLDAIGAIEITITNVGIEAEPERATGVIISADGYVLTAAHIFSDEAYAICSAAPGVAPTDTCAISFYPKGNRARRVSAQIASVRSDAHDFILLRLPSANDVIDRPEWPYVFVGAAPGAGAALVAGGYPGEQELRQGGPNPLGLVPGIMSASPSHPCTQGGGWGVSNQMSGQTAPGYSGGPVFDARRRLVAIVLGRSCTTDLQGAATTRILTLASMPNLCTTVQCRHGLAGYIAPYDGTNAQDWRERTEGGTAAANDFTYQWRLTAVSQLANMTLLCPTFANPQAAQQVRDDYERGGELATIYYFAALNCTNSLFGNQAETVRARIFVLADAGYEPAQFTAGQMLMGPLWPKIYMAGASYTYDFSDNERADIARAMEYFNQSADRGWAASLHTRFTLCRMRVSNCRANAADLEQAAALGAWDARRELALFLLQGTDAPNWTARNNFSMQRNSTRALALLRDNAQFVQVASAQPFSTYDIPSAAWLAYIYGGGQIGGREIVAPDLNQALLFEQQCYGGLQPNPALSQHLQCGLMGAVARFNLGAATDQQMARDSLRFISQFSSAHGQAARNILSWMEDAEIRRISCDLNADLDFAPPARAPTLQNGVAYCHSSPN